MMLLDTHYLIWAMFEPQKLSNKAKKIMADPDNLLFFSAISILEIEIKKQLGKINVPDSFHEKLEEAGFLELPIHAIHATGIKNLPDLHKDPFDRLLLAQSMHEKWSLITADEALLKYQLFYNNIVKI